jgi:hypothetical protein
MSRAALTFLLVLFAIAAAERDVHGYLASFQDDPRRKFAAMNDLCKAFKDEAPDTARTSLMLAKLEEILNLRKFRPQCAHQSQRGETHSEQHRQAARPAWRGWSLV